MKKQSRVLEIWDAIRRNKAAMLGLVILLLFILITIFADLIAPYELVTTQKHYGQGHKRQTEKRAADNK